MCAINGITTNDPDRVRRMNELTAHRGPDGSRIWEGNGVTFGHNRLAIIDLSDRALQPMESTDGRYHIVFNGEIYNYRELRTELEASYPFKTESDTEVLLAAYARWGESMLHRLRGMFAFGLWDRDESSLLLVRDQMGVKPLYFEVRDGVLAFSSELRALTETLSPYLDKTAVSLFLEFQYVPSPHTLVEGIEKLRPGHLLRFKNGKRIDERYYVPEDGRGVPSLDIHGAVTHENLYAGIDRAVHRQLVSDRPIGMFLSGGLDSSIVLHHMSHHSTDVRTFSVDFEMVSGAESEAAKFNSDARLAAQTAKEYGAHHTTYTLALDDVVRDLEQVLSNLDEPVANPTAVSQYFLSKHVRDGGVVVALGGDGGDELFLGYTRHRMLMAAYQFQRLPTMLQALLARAHPRIAKLRIPFGAGLHATVMANKEKHIMPYLKGGIHPYRGAHTFLEERYAALPRGLHPLEAFMHVDRSMWLPDESLLRTDRTGMAHGLELRVPLLDLDVVAIADRIPVDQKLTPFEGKRILRELYRSHLPKYLFDQPKRGWVSPGAKWLRDPRITSFVTEVLSPAYYDGLSSLYEWGAIERLLLDHVEKRTYALYPLWNLLALQLWARKNGVVYRD